jgi:nicotinate-nucleotide adenylyltransferase
MGKTIALFGGSFNPPHEGHFEMAQFIQRTLQVDETWLSFSVNPEKCPQDYASLEDRMNMANILAPHYDSGLVLSDTEAKIAQDIGKYDTYYVLEELQKRQPEDKFIFVMGADSFAKFDTWLERADILQNYIVAVVNRPGYTEIALNSDTAKSFADCYIDITMPEHLQSATHGWCFLDSPKIDMASSTIMQQLHEGKRDFTGHFAEVADYIYEKGLYHCQKHNNIPKRENMTYA